MKFIYFSDLLCQVIGSYDLLYDLIKRSMSSPIFGSMLHSGHQTICTIIGLSMQVKCSTLLCTIIKYGST